jgi:hypothetical protein
MVQGVSRLLALLAIAGALVVGGCGDDDEPRTTTSSGATRSAGSIGIEQWTTQADRICAAGDRAQQQTAAQQFGDEPPTQSELEEFGTAVVVPNLQGQHDAIEGLPKPEAEADRIDAMLSAIQEGIDAIAGDPSLLIQGTDSVPAIQDATEIAEQLGLTDCGSG